MASDAAANLKIHFRNVLKNIILPNDLLKSAGKAAGAFALDLIRKRTMQGFDENSSKFKSYSKKYPKIKQKYISGSSKLAKKYPKLDRFAAEKVRDVGQLSGRFFAGFAYKTVKVKRSGSQIDFSIDLALSTKAGPGKAPSAADKDAFLRGKGFNIFGLAKSGAFKKKEEDALKKFLKQYLKLNSNASAIIE